MEQQVFISYSRRDGNEYAERLHAELKAAGYRVWRDTRNINPNQDFTAEIEMGIKNSDIVAVCVTPDLERPTSFVRREIQYADVVKKPAFPCRVTDTPPPIPIINKEWLEFHKDWPGSFGRLCQLVTNPNLQQPPGEYQAPPPDPFRDYLQTLYERIVRYLNQAVIKLIDLEAETSPDAVPKKQTDDILLEFFESSVFADDTATDDLPKHTTFKDAFDHHKGRLLLLGEPGAGKTITLMSHARDAVAERLTDHTRPLPVLRIAATWKSNPPQPIIDWLTEDIDALKPAIANGKALLLFDGLDELGERGEIRTEVKDAKTGKPIIDEETHEPEVKITYYDPRRRFIDAVVDLHTNNQILVTCRVQDYAAVGQQIPLDGAITLQPLTDDQLHEYLADHTDIYAAIQDDEQLRELARTPLLLSLITFAWDKLDDAVKSKGDLQAGDVRDAIFEAYCKQRYEHEAKKHHAYLPFTYQEMMEVLGELAMWNANEYRAGRRSRYDGYSRPEENVLIPYDLKYVINDGERIEQFKQMTTQLNILAPVNESDYRFVHLLLRDFLAFDFVLPRIQDVRWYREDGVNPIYSLGWIGDPRAVEPLIGCLADDNPRVRLDAAGALGVIGGPRAVEGLIGCLHDADRDVRTSVAEALGQIGGPRAVEGLIWLLADENKHVRGSAAGALNKLGWQAQNEDQEIQYLIASRNWDQLTKKGHVAVEPLIGCLGDDDGRLRGSAVGALGWIGDARAVDGLIGCLGDKDEYVRGSAAVALGWIGDARAVKPLIGSCLVDNISRVRSNAAEALGQIGDAGAVEPLIGCLGDKNKHVRRSAAVGLGVIGDVRAVRPLIGCLEDKTTLFLRNRVCDYAYDALQKIGTPEALQACADWVAAGNTPRPV